MVNFLSVEKSQSRGRGDRYNFMQFRSVLQKKIRCQISIRELKDLFDRWDWIGRTSLK
jgi:hypothetical protein